VAFYSQSGGSGKTTLAFETATMVAEQAGARVAVLDLDCVSSSMRVRSGLDGLGMTDLLKATVLDGPALESVLLRHPGGTRVVHATSEIAAHPGYRDGVVALLDHLDAAGYEVVVLDLGSGALEHDGGLAAVLSGSLDAVYCVFNPTPGSVMGLYRAVATLRRNGLRDRIRLVLNRHDTPISLDEIQGDLRVDVLASVPTIAAVAAAERTHMPACMDDESVADALYPIAEDIFPDMSARWFDRVGRSAQSAGVLP
jgi:MinD-like ATPase involved in chromosome partitioning or flagellar assembly